MLPTSLFFKCYVVLWPSLKKSLPHPIDLRNQSRTPDFVVENTLTIRRAQLGFNCTRPQPKHWSPLNHASGQVVIERWALVAWVGALAAIEGSYTSSLISKHGDVVIWMVCAQLPQSSCVCSSCQSKVAYQYMETSGGVDTHDFIPNFAVSGIVIQLLMPVARWLGEKHM